jgi:hypothetical protein
MKICGVCCCAARVGISDLTNFIAGSALSNTLQTRRFEYQKIKTLVGDLQSMLGITIRIVGT